MIDDFNIYVVISVIVPGYVIAKVRQNYQTGRNPFGLDAIYQYLTFGFINFTLCSYIVYVIQDNSIALQYRALGWTFVILVAPLMIGILSIRIGESEWFSSVLDFLSLEEKRVNPIPTAWDHKFRLGRTEWIVVTMKNGEIFRGYYGPNSFASSDPNERDLYIQEIFETDKWDSSERSLLISSSEIRTIEFIPFVEEEKNE